MPDRTKIATCCYCGHRTLLTFTKGGRHELACSACGAPLHEMKFLKKPASVPEPQTTHKARGITVPVPRKSTSKKKRKSKRQKKTNPLLYFLKEGVEEIFEEIFD